MAELRSILCAVLALTLCPFSAKADLFNFSYTFESGSVISGSFEGTMTAGVVSGPTNISAFYNSIPLNGSGSLFESAVDGPTTGFGTARISPNVAENNFIFMDIQYEHSETVSQCCGTNYFYFIGSLPQIIFLLGNPNGIQEVDRNQTYLAGHVFSADRWSMTPVPEPATLALLALGLAGLGFSRRRSAS